MSEAHKYTKEEIEAPDKFQVFVSKLSAFVAKRKITLLVCAILLATAFGGTIAYYSYLQYADRQLQETLKGVDGRLDSLDYTSEDSVNTILAEYQALIDGHTNTAVASYAGIRRAGIFYRLNLDEKTLEELTAISKNIDHDPIYRALATFKIVEIHRNGKTIDEALAILNAFSIIEFEERKLFELGITFLLANDVERAKQNFQTLTQQYGDSVYVNFSKLIIELL